MEEGSSMTHPRCIVYIIFTPSISFHDRLSGGSRRHTCSWQACASAVWPTPTDDRQAVLPSWLLAVQAEYVSLAQPRPPPSQIPEK